MLSATMVLTEYSATAHESAYAGELYTIFDFGLGHFGPRE